MIEKGSDRRDGCWRMGAGQGPSPLSQLASRRIIAMYPQRSRGHWPHLSSNGSRCGFPTLTAFGSAMQLIPMFIEICSWLFDLPKRWHWTMRWLVRLGLLLTLVLLAALIITPER